MSDSADELRPSIASATEAAAGSADAFHPPRMLVGAWQLSAGHHRRGMDAEQALEVFLALIERGVTTFDCADIYTGVEELLGRVRKTAADRLGVEVAAHIRIHTKLVPDREALSRVDRAYVQGVVDRSLRRLGVERLDLVQLAWWDYGVPGWVEAADHLDALRRAGKIRHVGATNFDVPRLAEILDAGIPVAAHQVQYSALDHRPESGMTDLAIEKGISLLTYGALAGGFLSDAWAGRPDPAPGGVESARELANRSLTKYRLVIDEYGGWEAFQSLLETLGGIAARHGASLAKVALRYVLDRPAAPSVILGVSRLERMEEALGALDLRLEAEELARVEALAARAPGPAGDCFGLERDLASPHAAVMKYDLNRI